jgi:hypothetical protein
MLDLRFKNLYLKSFVFGQEEGVSIMDECDRRTLYLMFLKCYHHLHPLTKFAKCANQIGDDDYSLNIFQQTAFTSEP